VRIFQDGEVVLRIEPLARPMVWEHFRLGTQDANGTPAAVVNWPAGSGEHAAS
jgi:hypothetical protein